MTADRNAQIAARAYAIWQAEGCPEGQALRHWLQAEKETSASDRTEEAAPPQPKTSAAAKAA